MDWEGWREGLKRKRQSQLAESDTTGFKRCTPYHYQIRWRWQGKMYYGTADALRGFVRKRGIKHVAKVGRGGETKENDIP